MSAEFEVRIMSHMAELLQTQTEKLQVFLQEQIRITVEKCLQEYVKSLVSSSSPVLSSQNSSSGSSGVVACDVLVGDASPGGISNLDVLCLWPVACPVCGANTFANEKVFDEHIKHLYAHRHQAYNMKLHCVLRDDNPQHAALLSSWVRSNVSWFDKVEIFCKSLRALLTPGAKAVYRPGGTGNHVKVQSFIQSCLSGSYAAGAAP